MFKRIGAVAAATGVVLTLAAGTAQAQERIGFVSRVLDGDTVEVHNEGRTTTVRVLGIDTPETKHPRRGVECGGPEATDFARRTLLGQDVTLVPDASQDGTDRYGRMLAYVVRMDGWDYSVEAARAGVARAYVYDDDRPPVRAGVIAAAEAEARFASPPRGLWGPPCEGRR